MLSSQRLELRILRYVREGTSDGWRATTLPELANAVKCQDWSEVIDALKRLHHEDSIRMRKWIEPRGFVYYAAGDNGTDFFHRTDFQIGITFQGRTYMEALEAQEKLEKALTDNPGAATVPDREELREELTQSLKNISRVVSGPLLFTRQIADTLALVAPARTVFQEIFAAHPAVVAARGFREWQDSFTLTMEPILDAYRRIGEQLAKDMERHNLLFRVAVTASPMIEKFRTIVDQARAIETVNLTLPKVVPTAWPADILGARLGLIEDALKNVNEWQKLREQSLQALGDLPRISIAPETLDIAGQFVYDHGLFIRRLPPSIRPDDLGRKEEEEFRHRDEEVGAKLEAELGRLDANLVSLRRRAWEDLAKGDAAAARLAAHGIREVYGEILRRLAPDEEVKKSPIWEREGQSRDKPTRRMRVEFIMGSAAEELDALLQFDESLQETHKFAHTFAENSEVVRVQMAQLENCTYLLLVYARARKS